MTTFYLLSISALLLHTVFNVVLRVSLHKNKYVSAYTIVFQFFAGIIALFFIPFDSFAFSLTPYTILLLILSICLWALADALLFMAYKKEEASTLAGILPITNAITILISVAIFGSLLTVPTIIGFSLILFASLFVTMYGQEIKNSKAMFLGVLSRLFAGMALAIGGELVQSFSAALFVAVCMLFPAATNYLFFLRPSAFDIRAEIKQQWKAILFNAFIASVALFLVLKAFQLGNIPQAVSILALSPVLITITGILLLKERDHIPVKIIAAITATLGVIISQM